MNEAEAAKSSPDSEKPKDTVLSETEVVEKVTAALSELFMPLYTLRETVEKTYSSSIAYMDRVVLLAGGTLTLTFTALTMISSHLQDAARSADHPFYVIAECWLLVVTIAFGLAYTRLVIVLREKSDQTFVISQAALVGRLKVMSLNLHADMSKYPDFKNDPIRLRVKALTILSTICSLIVHVALTGAFVCLACFIQSNIGVILNVPHK